MRRLRFPLSVASAILALGATGALVARDASAAWPPDPSFTAADMADPANWPDDPSYGYSMDDNGQFPFYSFIPTQEAGSTLRKEETAAGMSIDLAFRHTIGDPSIILAITDSGIEWDHRDLIEKIFLNVKELAGHEPTHADGSPCGGTGEIAGFDCNGDGVLSVGDYSDTPTLTPAASEGHPQGDRNQNGVLDAGDLILAFSDGVDADGNGYVDDIAGWDFFKDDNDPYDDIRYGHGTGEARHAGAATNNGIGTAGVCPRCRVMPLRVADSFVADVNSFGKALVYARDNHVSAVNAALGGLDMSGFAQRALDYAYEGGVVVVNAMADENARHQNFPATANHTLPVHAITVDGHSTRASSFLAYNPCTNYGGQNMLSVSGEGCSSEAVANTVGIVGLILSAGLEAGVTPKLHAGEIQNLLITTADDIDVPESQGAGSPYYWSQKGFDQRFGYGRVNANTAVERVIAGKIPPIVDIVSPTWFSVLYQGRGEPVAIEGRISASRATSYDYTVEWAPGVQPLDTKFHLVAKMENVDPTVVTGQGGPIATLDPDMMDPTHVADPDSPHGENRDAITVRIRAVAHYGGSIGDVVGKMHRTYYVHRDDTRLPGFPLYVGASGEASPKLADVDGDGIRDIVFATSDGDVHVYRATPSGPEELLGFPFRANRIDGLATPAPTPATPVYLAAPGYGPGGVGPEAREAFMGAPAVADLDGDGVVDIVASSFAGTIYAIDALGHVKPGFPIRLPNVPSCPLDPTTPANGPCMGESATLARGAFASPVLVDLDKDGKLEIVQAAFDGNVYAFHADGSTMDGYPVTIHYQGKLSQEPARNRILTTPAVGDFNGDGIPELLVGSNEKLSTAGFSGAIYLIDGRGNAAPGGPYLPNWPVTITSLNTFPLVGEGVPNSGVIGTLGGEPVAIMHGNGSAPMILPADPGPQVAINTIPPNGLPRRKDDTDPEKTRLGIEPTSQFGPLSVAAQPDTMLPLFSQPSLGDVDQDGVLDVIASGSSLKVAIAINPNGAASTLKGDQLLAMWSGKTGAMMPASPIPLEDFTFLNSQAIVDLNGDDYPEVVTGSSGYFVHAYDACGREAKGFPKLTGQWILTTPAFGDLDGDGKLDMVVATRNGWLYAWKTDATTDSMIQWESFHHDNRNTGNLDTPLDQGDPKRRAKKPLTVEICQAATVEEPPADDVVVTVFGGGCDCEIGNDGRARGQGGVAAVIAVAGMVIRSRRRRGR